MLVSLLQTYKNPLGKAPNNMSISLQKGSSLSLKKNDGSTLTNVRLGLGWDSAKRGIFGGEVDLDASAILLDANGNAVDIVSFSQLASKDGSIRHSGDNLTGAGDGDDEQIAVNLNAVNAAVKSIVFVITSYSGQKFSAVKNVYARVVDTSANPENEIVRYDLAESANNTANVIAKISRDGAGWAFTAIGEYTDGKTAKKTLPAVVRHA
jgi:tellurium resistance protein TerZ